MTADQKQPGSTPPDVRQFTFRKDYSLNSGNVLSRLGVVIGSTEILPIEREKLEGKVALITGSSRGIGAATARLFGEFGMNVVINSRIDSKNRAEQVLEDIEARGGKGLWLPGDVTGPQDVETLIGNIYNEYERLDVVVNNVGTTDDGLMIQMRPNQWYDVMMTNAFSAFLVTKFAASKMMRQTPRGGMIVFVSSVGQEGLPGQANYAASKRAMEAVADVAAQEYGSRNIYTSIIRVGYTETELTQKLTDKQKQGLLDMLPSHRAFQPEEVARGIAYLATLKESGHVMTLA